MRRIKDILLRGALSVILVGSASWAYADTLADSVQPDRIRPNHHQHWHNRQVWDGDQHRRHHRERSVQHDTSWKLRTHRVIIHSHQRGAGHQTYAPVGSGGGWREK